VAGQYPFQWFNIYPFWDETPAPEKTVPIYLGGSSPKALERVARVADGFNPFGRKHEFISAPGSPTPPGFHYGYTEFRMIDEGLAQSRVYRENAALIKATGRYRFPTISRLLRRLPVFHHDLEKRHRKHAAPLRARSDGRRSGLSGASFLRLSFFTGNEGIRAMAINEVIRIRIATVQSVERVFRAEFQRLYIDHHVEQILALDPESVPGR